MSPIIGIHRWSSARMRHVPGQERAELEVGNREVLASDPRSSMVASQHSLPSSEHPIPSVLGHRER